MSETQAGSVFLSLTIRPVGKRWYGHYISGQEGSSVGYVSSTGRPRSIVTTGELGPCAPTSYSHSVLTGVAVRRHNGPSRSRWGCDWGRPFEVAKWKARRAYGRASGS